MKGAMLIFGLVVFFFVAFATAASDFPQCGVGVGLVWLIGCKLIEMVDDR